MLKSVGGEQLTAETGAFSLKSAPAGHHTTELAIGRRYVDIPH